jgi:hypothetical protein
MARRSLRRRLDDPFKFGSKASFYLPKQKIQMLPEQEAVKDDIPSMIIVIDRSQPEGFGNSGLPAQSGTKDQQWPSYCQYSTGPSSSERVLFWVDWPDCSILVRHRATSELQSAPMCDSGLVWRRPHQNWHGDRN